MMLIALWTGVSLADTVTLRNGGSFDGTLTHYEADGTCNIHVDTGVLEGADVVLPCANVARVDRVPKEALALPEGAVLLLDEPAIEEVAVSASPPVVDAALVLEPDSAAVSSAAGAPPDEDPLALASDLAPEESGSPSTVEMAVAEAPPEEAVNATSPEPVHNRSLGTFQVTWPKFRAD
jgi:hypothetical protein